MSRLILVSILHSPGRPFIFTVQYMCIFSETFFSQGEMVVGDKRPGFAICMTVRWLAEKKDYTALRGNVSVKNALPAEAPALSAG